MLKKTIAVITWAVALYVFLVEGSVVKDLVATLLLLIVLQPLLGRKFSMRPLLDLLVKTYRRDDPG
jgi:hypothetical protein